MSCSKLSTCKNVPMFVRMKIPREKLLIESQKEEDWFIQSEVFNVEELSGVSYYIGIGSRDTGDDEKESYVFFFLHMEKELNLSITLKVSIPSATYDKTIEENKDGTHHTYCSITGPTNELFDPTKNFFVKDYMVIVMEAVLSVKMDPSSDVVGMDCDKHCKCKLGAKWWDQDDKDLTVIIGENEIQVHKLVLSIKSPVFDRMFKSGTEESKENKLTIDDFDFEIVELGLKFCYGIKEENLWKVENAVELLRFAVKYEILELKTLIETFLFSQINRMYVCKIANISIISNSVNLREKCFDFILECNQKRTFIADLDLLDKDFAADLIKTLYSRFPILPLENNLQIEYQRALMWREFYLCIYRKFFCMLVLCYWTGSAVMLLPQVQNFFQLFNYGFGILHGIWFASLILLGLLYAHIQILRRHLLFKFIPLIIFTGISCLLIAVQTISYHFLTVILAFVSTAFIVGLAYLYGALSTSDFTTVGERSSRFSMMTSIIKVVLGFSIVQEMMIPEMFIPWIPQIYNIQGAAHSIFNLIIDSQQICGRKEVKADVNESCFPAAVLLADFVQLFIFMLGIFGGENDVFLVPVFIRAAEF